MAIKTDFLEMYLRSDTCNPLNCVFKFDMFTKYINYKGGAN